MKIQTPHKKPAYASRGKFAFWLTLDLVLLVLSLHFLREDVHAHDTGVMILQAAAAILWAYFTYADVHRWYVPKVTKGDQSHTES